MTNDFESNGKILSLNKNGAETFLNPRYASRVTGRRSGNLKSSFPLMPLANKMQTISSAL